MNDLRSVWERFWFAPQATSSLALLRIAFGFLALCWTLSLAPDIGAFFGPAGILPQHLHVAGNWGVLAIFHSETAAQILFAVLLVACVALTVGYQSRVAALLVFVGLTSFERRNPYVFNTGDGVMRLIAFYLMLAPSGAALSLDRLRRAPGRFWEFPARSAWPLRLMQVQLSVIYIAGLWVKFQGTAWNDGTAVGYAVRVSDLSRFPVPAFFKDSAVIANLLTYGTLLTEASIGILVWNRKLRPWVLLAGVFLHEGIDWSIRVGFFSLAMLTLYLSFLDPDWASERLLALRGRLAERRARRRAEAQAPAAAEA